MTSRDLRETVLQETDEFAQLLSNDGFKSSIITSKHSACGAASGRGENACAVLVDVGVGPRPADGAARGRDPRAWSRGPVGHRVRISPPTRGGKLPVDRGRTADGGTPGGVPTSVAGVRRVGREGPSCPYVPEAFWCGLGAEHAGRSDTAPRPLAARCRLHDAADFAAPILAALASAPNVTHSFGSVTPVQNVAGAAAETDPLWRAHGFEPRPFGGLYDHLYLDIYPPSMQIGDLSHIGRIQLLNAVPLAAGGGDERRSETTAVIGDAARVVYLTFGTVFNVNSTFAGAVEALARFEDAETFVTVGPAGDVDAFGPQPEHVHIQRYVRHAELLPRCAAVVSHAGSGTLLGSLALGIPQVCLPQAADQFRNADACVAAGAGIALIGEDATSDAIEAALRRVLTDEDMRHRAQRIGAEIEAMPSADQVAAVIERL